MRWLTRDRAYPATHVSLHKNLRQKAVTIIRHCKITAISYSYRPAHREKSVTAGPIDDSYFNCGTLSHKTSCDSWACLWHLYDLWHTVKQNIMWQLGLPVTLIWPVAHCQAKHHVTAGPVDNSYLSCGTLSSKTSCDSWACGWQLSNLWHTVKQNIMWQLGLSVTVI